MGFIRKLAPFSEKTLMKNEVKQPEKFWVCDIESYQWINFVTIGLTDGEEFRHFEDLSAFFEYLTLDGRSKIIYAHFGGKFDFLFLLNWLFFQPGWSVLNMIPRGSGLLCFDVQVEMGNSKILKLTFRDSSAMLPFGLKSLTKNFKVKSLKQEWDHSKTLPQATPELLTYCEYDCRGLHEVIEKYHHWPIIRRAGSAPTIAGQALKVLRTYLDVEIWSLKPRVDRFVRQAYFGGRTEIFKPLYLGSKKLRCYDVNSLYPTVMREPPKVGDVPHGYPSKFKYFTFEYDPTQIGFYEATVEVPADMYVPPLGVVWEVDKQKKFIFPTGRFNGVWSTLELEYAKSLGVKVISTGQGAIFENGGLFFKKYVDELYEIRERSERESVDNVLAKLLLNSCYGRFGLRCDREGIVVDEGQEGVRDSEDDEGFLLTDGKHQLKLVRQPKHIETFNNVAVSAWVTSASRVHMHRIYMEAPEKLYYTDTDSLFTSAEYEDSKGLGGLKLEYDCECACFLLPKTYVVEGLKPKQTDYVTDEEMSGEDLADLLGVSFSELKELNQEKIEDWSKIPKGKEIKFKSDRKITMKGFDRKKTGRFTVEDFMTALEGELRTLRVVQAPKFATFRTALGKKKLLTMLPEGLREIRSMYDKRIVYKKEDGTYDTRPHFIQDSQPIVTEKHNKKLKILDSMGLAAANIDLDEFFMEGV